MKINEIKESASDIVLMENFLKEDIFLKIKNILLSSDFPWFYNSYTGDINDKNNFLFYHYLFKDNQQTSDFFNLILVPILSKLECSLLLRAKINLYTKKEKAIKTAYHVDQKYNHKVALFSINSNNGFTLFEDGRNIISKENQIAFFDGDLKHSSVNQTDENLRINININYL